MAQALDTPAAHAAPGVVVPVYNGFAETARCLASLERQTPAAIRILLVNDASTDPRVPPLLRDFASRRANVEVLSNERNLGFVGAVNRALERSPGDVVVLNSDTEVTAGWLEGLMRCRASDAAIGIVCPLSNRATILTLEGVAGLFARDDGTPDVDGIGDCVRRASARQYPRLPTAVGFCMLVTRPVLAAAGPLDPVYARGYGEENDLSMRALGLGFEIACADDVYVHHAGEASFGMLDGVDAERARNTARLERRWPAYTPGVASWARANPLRGAVERVNALAERERLPGRVRVLQVVHRLETRGGIEEHTRALVNRLKDDAVFTILVPGHGERGRWSDFAVERPAPHLRIVRMNPDLAEHNLRVMGHLANVADGPIERAFASLLEGGFDVVHFQSLVGWNTMRLPRIARDAGARVVLSAHDVSLACADYNMIVDDRPCGRDAAHGSDAGCVSCIRGKSEAIGVRGAPSISGFIDERYALASDAIAASDALVCPSEYLAGRMRRAFGEVAREKVRVIGHGVADFPLIYGAPDRQMLRVAFLGRFGDRKGADVLLEAARELAGQRIVFEVWGQVEDRFIAPARAAGMSLRGMYRAADLERVLRGIDLVVMPTKMEESFCLVVSEAQRLGIPVAASRMGAIPERIRDGETGFLLPPGDVRALASLLLRLRDDRAALRRVAATLRDERPKTIAENAVEYLALYREILAGPARPSAAKPSAGNGDFVRECLALPRKRRRTPLGADEYDRWLDRHFAAPGEPPAREIAVIRLPARDAEASLVELNRAVAESEGDWVGIVQEGDLLAAGAIAAMSRECERHPSAALIHCDDDAVSVRGERYDPVFKPRFSPELLRHRPYIAGFCALNRARVIERGGLRAPGWPGVVDFALRLAEENASGAVIALRRLLCHRLDVNIRALDDEDAARRLQQVVAAHVRRAPQAAARAAGRVSVCVLAADAPGRVVACLEALIARASGRIDEIFVDMPTAACGEIAGALRTGGAAVRIASSLEAGAGPLATAFRRARNPWVVVADARCDNFAPAWLDRLESDIRPFVAGVAPQVIDTSGAPIPGWEVLGGGPWSIAGTPPPLRGAGALAELYGAPREVSVLAARLAMFRRGAALECGGLDDASLAGTHQIAHLCLALTAAGFDLLSRPFVAADFNGATRAAPQRADSAPLGTEWMRARWRDRLADDPFYHPALNLTGARLGPHIGFRPRTPGAAAMPRVCAFPFDRWGSGEVRVRQPFAALARGRLAQVLVMPEHDSGHAPNALEMGRLAPNAIYAHNFFHDYQLVALEEYARGAPCLRILGMDDLLTELPPDNPFAATIYPDIAARIARALSLCDRLVVSTPRLAEAYGQGKDVRVIPNAIDDERWRGLANTPRGGARPRVGWAGARQHLGDLALLEQVVKATCGEVDWVFLGMCPASIRPLAREFHGMVPVGRYPAKLASLGLDVAVAPLQDHPFNRAKSSLKVLEYGILGIPVVASSVVPYLETPARLVSPDAQSWIDAILELARDRDGARERGCELRRYVLAHAMLSGSLHAWNRALDPAR